jgi:cadmium resistance protein CadD (predicted permease)
MTFHAIASKRIFILIPLFSEEEAKKKIYSVCTTTYTGFGALISEELSYKVKGEISWLYFFLQDIVTESRLN